MTNLRQHIIDHYLHVVERLERGYKEELDVLIDEIFLEQYGDRIKNNQFLISKLIHGHTI